MLDKILHNKITYLLTIFIVFILIWAILLNLILDQKIVLESSYLYILHIISLIVWSYLLNMIFKDKNQQKKWLFIKNIFLQFSLLLLILIWIYFLFNLSLINYLIIWFIISSIIFSIDSRISFSIALILLFYVVFYISSWDNKTAEKLSIYTYYFLVIWVWLEILSSLLENKKTL